MHFTYSTVLCGNRASCTCTICTDNDTTKCLRVCDSLLSDNFGKKVDKQIKASYYADTISLIDKYFRKGMSRKVILSIPKGKRPAPETYLRRRYIRRI